MEAPRTAAIATLSAALAVAATGVMGAGAATDPVVGIRSITTAHGSVVPECLTLDEKGRATVAGLCFREGRDHSWQIMAIAGAPGSYVMRRGNDCLTLDPTRVPPLLGRPCSRDHLGQAWQITARTIGEYQISQGGACVQAKTGEAALAPCVKGRNALGSDDSGQAWKFLKDPDSVVPDPGLGGKKDGK